MGPVKVRPDLSGCGILRKLGGYLFEIQNICTGCCILCGRSYLYVGVLSSCLVYGTLLVCILQ